MNIVNIGGACVVIGHGSILIVAVTRCAREIIEACRDRDFGGMWVCAMAVLAAVGAALVAIGGE